MLTISALGSVRNRLECRTCPYEHPLTGPIYSRKDFERKEREDVFGGEGEWDNADKTTVQCPREGCDGTQAAFYQVQIRSADEPMTTFLKVSSLGPCGSLSLSLSLFPSLKVSVEGLADMAYLP